MKRLFGLGSVIGGSIALLAAQPALADATRVTGILVNQSATGATVTLETSSGDRPQVFTVTRGNALTADIINTQLDLPQGNGYLQNNPAPGISSIMVTQLDANSIRVTVNGEGSAPVAQVEQNRRSIVLNYDLSATGQAPGSTPIAAPPIGAPPLTPTPVNPPVAQVPPPIGPGAPDGVLIPNPEITIDGLPALPPGSTYTPPLAPRAIAPPLGDIATSTLNAAPEGVDLDTTEIVPRLVLRDAPARDVLSLLARAAGLNVAYIADNPDQAAQADPTAAPPPPGGEASADTRISLDIENEPVQNVFNFVLRITGLQANRVGRTIFVGPQLPDDSRNVIIRTLRLNQVPVTDAANFLTTQGAETQIPIERVEIQSVGEGAAARTIEIRTPDILALRAQQGSGPLLLRGLSVSTNNRLNSVTLVGSPAKVELASSLLSQLDLRRRQVAINVKIVDINLLATEDFGTSFSFGIGDTFFSTDGGAASFNYGGVNPPSRTDINGSRLSPPITAAPFPPGVDEVEPFLDAQPDAPFGTGDPQPFGEPPLNDGTIRIPGAIFARPPFGTDSNPLQGGVTDVQGGQIEFGLPELFQYPSRFLASLQAQVVSGNAKILTDPTLVIQEGQTANVDLTQDVVTNVQVQFTDSPGGTREDRTFEISPAGLQLEILVDRIDDNGFVTISVNPTVTSPIQTFTSEDGDELTLLSRREVNSGLLRLRDAQTLILSGIISETDRTEVSKIPILGDIPILGALFRSTNRENTRQEVIVLLTPQILDDSDISSFGYSYTPSRNAQEVLQRQGVQVP